jgi:hypothetical protein
MKQNYVIAGLVGAVVVLVGVIVYLILKDKTTALNPYKQTVVGDTSTTAPANDNQNKNVKNYRGNSFEFQYPSNLSLYPQEKSIRLTHSVPYRHTDPCDMRDGAKPLDEITDFDVSIEYFNKNLGETARSIIPQQLIADYIKGNSFRITPGVVDEYKVGSLKGYKITNGVEGCGVYNYYISLSANKTLYISRSFVPEFNAINAEYQKYLNVPGIIPPGQEEDIFNLILSSFKTKTE